MELCSNQVVHLLVRTSTFFELVHVTVTIRLKVPPASKMIPCSALQWTMCAFLVVPSSPTRRSPLGPLPYPYKLIGVNILSPDSTLFHNSSKHWGIPL